MKKLRQKLYHIYSDMGYIFLNYIVNSIPCWHIRKLFYKLAGMKIGEKSRIHMKAIVIMPKNIQIGERTIINERCFIDGRGGLTIGNDVSISVFSMIITGSHDKSSPTFAYRSGQIVIEDNVWLGSRVIILDNSTIRKFCVIGAGSVLKGVTSENSVYVGIPAKKICDRKLENMYHLTYNPYFR